MAHDLFIGLWPLALNYTNCPLEIDLNQTLGFESHGTVNASPGFVPHPDPNVLCRIQCFSPRVHFFLSHMLLRLPIVFSYSALWAAETGFQSPPSEGWAKPKECWKCQLLAVWLLLFFSSCFGSRRFAQLWQSLIYGGPHWDVLAWVAREPASGNAVDRSSSSASHLGTSVLSLSLIDFVAWLARRSFANFLITVGCVTVAPLHSQSLLVKVKAPAGELAGLTCAGLCPDAWWFQCLWVPGNCAGCGPLLALPWVRLSLRMQTFRRTC